MVTCSIDDNAKAVKENPTLEENQILTVPINKPTIPNLSNSIPRRDNARVVEENPTRDEDQIPTVPTTGSAIPSPPNDVSGTELKKFEVRKVSLGQHTIFRIRKSAYLSPDMPLPHDAAEL